MTDWDLLQDYAKHGSEAAFGKIVERHLSFVYQVCRREIGDSTAAEDASLAVFLLLANKAKTIRKVVPLRSWLFISARFVARNTLKTVRRRTAMEAKAIEMAKTESEYAAIEGDGEVVEAHLNEALGALSNRERDALLLRYNSGMDVSEVAQALGISQSAAQMRLARGVEKMRVAMAKRGVAADSSAVISTLASLGS